MIADGYTNNFLKLLLVLIILLPVPRNALAAADMVELIPPVSCGTAWKIEGKSLFYDRETLSDRINGEAELYFPYGFDRMVAARYVADKNPAVGMDVEIYRMGSPLDAFGMYANYRQKDGRSLAVGAESNFSGSQLFFYQSRHFVHIQITGAEAADPDIISECANAVGLRLPGDRKRPPELSPFDRAEVLRGTERYLPQSLLGYDFLNKGIMADAMLGEVTLQIFFLVAATDESATVALGRYESLLAQGRIEAGGKSTTFLDVVDPLYGPVMVIRNRNCLAGALKFIEKKGIKELLESFCR
ncbi:MAG: hypothetical protein Q7W05_13705 [Deltaproteobacteria bacterium]|nr:hypothetical protein [Deltaproteobacteria bacterium]